MSHRHLAVLDDGYQADRDVDTPPRERPNRYKNSLLSPGAPKRIFIDRWPVVYPYLPTESLSQQWYAHKTNNGNGSSATAAVRFHTVPPSRSLVVATTSRLSSTSSGGASTSASVRPFTVGSGSGSRQRSGLNDVSNKVGEGQTPAPANTTTTTAVVPHTVDALQFAFEQTPLLYKMHKSDCRLVKATLEVNGFRQVSGAGWSLMWCGCHAKPHMYQGLDRHQRVNHFPRTYELTRKDKMYQNILRMQSLYGVRHFDFVPKTYQLPMEFSELYGSFVKDPGQFWIVKPCASSRGRGIYLVNNINQISSDESQIVSQYVSNPLLVDGYKFDLRVYVAVTSFDPLRIYMYKEGLARFASEKYTRNPKALDNLFVHLTNYSVNKKNADYVRNTDATRDDVGNKWSWSALRRYFAAAGIDDRMLMRQIKDIIVKSLISIDAYVNVATRLFVPHRSNCFELLGFDILIDENLRPWLVEVNLSPSLACDSPLDYKIKSQLMADTFNLLGIVPADRRKAREQERQRLNSVISNWSPQKGKKHGAAKALTAEERRVLRDTYEESFRAGNFERLFPTAESELLYDSFFEVKRDMNRLLSSHFIPMEFEVKMRLRQSIETGEALVWGTLTMDGTVYERDAGRKAEGGGEGEREREREMATTLMPADSGLDGRSNGSSATTTLSSIRRLRRSLVPRRATTLGSSGDLGISGLTVEYGERIGSGGSPGTAKSPLSRPQTSTLPPDSAPTTAASSVSSSPAKPPKKKSSRRPHTAVVVGTPLGNSATAATARNGSANGTSGAAVGPIGSARTSNSSLGITSEDVPAASERPASTTFQSGFHILEDADDSDTDNGDDSDTRTSPSTAGTTPKYHQQQQQQPQRAGAIHREESASVVVRGLSKASRPQQELSLTQSVAVFGSSSRAWGSTRAAKPTALTAADSAPHVDEFLIAISPRTLTNTSTNARPPRPRTSGFSGSPKRDDDTLPKLEEGFLRKAQTIAGPSDLSGTSELAQLRQGLSETLRRDRERSLRPAKRPATSHASSAAELGASTTSTGTIGPTATTTTTASHWQSSRGTAASKLPVSASNPSRSKSSSNRRRKSLSSAGSFPHSIDHENPTANTVYTGTSTTMAMNDTDTNIDISDSRTTTNVRSSSGNAETASRDRWDVQHADFLRRVERSLTSAAGNRSTSPPQPHQPQQHDLIWTTSSGLQRVKPSTTTTTQPHSRSHSRSSSSSQYVAAGHSAKGIPLRNVSVDVGATAFPAAFRLYGGNRSASRYSVKMGHVSRRS